MPNENPGACEPMLMLREITHRVCNEYSSAIAALSLAAAQSTSSDAKAVLSAAADRLFAFANVHRALQMPAEDDAADLADHLRAVCRALLRSHLDDRGIRLELAEERVELTPEQCWTVGLVVSELITNAAKHAFAERGGCIRVEIRRAGGHIRCSVMDDGEAATGPRPGHGTQIVDGLAARLGGRVCRVFSAGGSRISLIFPDGRYGIGGRGETPATRPLEADPGTV
ncbi:MULTISPECIES: sensor histidine kinase [Rhodomicrobium]|uniref:sensor histidine kinase n=1 Tax=Rhodomicrobium TaxID=1068 RepID=UPI000B4C1A23|nr:MULTISPECIES: sensor histidine kinase [Rhodomicrobium]